MPQVPGIRQDDDVSADDDQESRLAEAGHWPRPAIRRPSLHLIHQLQFSTPRHVLLTHSKIRPGHRNTRFKAQFPTPPCQSLPRKGHFSLRESSECEWFTTASHAFLLCRSHYLITSLPRLDPFQRTISMLEPASSVPQRTSSLFITIGLLINPVHSGAGMS